MALACAIPGCRELPTKRYWRETVIWPNGWVDEDLGGTLYCDKHAPMEEYVYYGIFSNQVNRYYIENVPRYKAEGGVSDESDE